MSKVFIAIGRPRSGGLAACGCSEHGVARETIGTVGGAAAGGAVGSAATGGSASARSAAPWSAAWSATRSARTRTRSASNALDRHEEGASLAQAPFFASVL